MNRSWRRIAVFRSRRRARHWFRCHLVRTLRRSHFASRSRRRENVKGSERNFADLGIRAKSLKGRTRFHQCTNGQKDNSR
jgi:hypothetical protein